MSICEHISSFPTPDYLPTRTPWPPKRSDRPERHCATPISCKRSSPVSGWLPERDPADNHLPDRGYSRHNTGFDARLDSSSLRSASSLTWELPSNPDLATLDQSVGMEHRAMGSRVTLPPLSSLTKSIDRDRVYERPPSRERHAFESGTTLLPRDVQSQSCRGSIDQGSARVSRPSSAVWPPLEAEDRGRNDQHGSPSLPSAASGSSPSLLPPPASVRGVFESSRPRAYSSPHRHRMHNPTRRSSLAESSDVDRLLEILIYIQDINRRLGLNTGSPASPSLFQNAGAAQILHDKVQEELSTMSHFSQSRAESVAKHLGLPTYFRSSRQLGERSASSEQRERSSALVSSGQASYSPWLSTGPPERPISPTSRLALEERRYREGGYTSQNNRSDTEHGYTRTASTEGPHVHSSQPSYPNPAPSAISRATSFEQLRTAHPRSYTSDYHEYGTPEEMHRTIGNKMSHDHPLRYDDGSSGIPPAQYPESRHQQQMELFDRRRLAGKGMKRVRKRKNEHHQECLGCQAKETPEWRKGPMGPQTLCNACGLLYAKLTKRKQQEAEATAKASGKTAEEIVREREESPGAKQASLEALRAELNLVNGLRNRATSSATSASHVSMLQQSPTDMTSPSAARYYDSPAKYTHSGSSSRQIYPRETGQPFAHLPPHQRSQIASSGETPLVQDRSDSHAIDISALRPYSGGGVPNHSIPAHLDNSHWRSVDERANSFGHVESFDYHVGRSQSMNSVAGSDRYQPRPVPMRPHSGGATPGMHQTTQTTGRQRSASSLQISDAPPFAHHYERSRSPINQTQPGIPPPGPHSQRRHHHHPYL